MPAVADGLIRIVVALLVVWAALVALLWAVRPRDVTLRELVSAVPDVVRLVRDLTWDRATPLRVRCVLMGLLVWLISPIDLIPEFVPVLGPLDDVVVAVLVLRWARRQLGLDELRRRWRGSEAGFELLKRLVGAD
jgi:uncharacterized membrane protein YkvA (DUF1232 family)